MILFSQTEELGKKRKEKEEVKRTQIHSSIHTQTILLDLRVIKRKGMGGNGLERKQIMVTFLYFMSF